MQEIAWVSPNKIGNNFKGNYCEINIAAAIKAKDAPTPCKKLARENDKKLWENEISI